MDAESNEAKVLVPSQMQPQEMKYSQTPITLQRGSNEKLYQIHFILKVSFTLENIYPLKVK